MAEYDLTHRRLTIVGIVVVSLFASLFVRLGYLQMDPNNGYRIRANGVNVRLVHQEGTRGRVLDRSGRVLVDNRVMTVVGFNRQDMRQLDEAGRQNMFDRLAAELTRYGYQTKAARLEELFKDKRYGPLEFVPVATEVSKEAELFLAEHQDEFPGVQARRETVRIYPYGTLAAHLVGYVGQINETELAAKRDQGLIPDESGEKQPDRDHKTYAGGDHIGKGGIESAAEQDLRGVPADRTIQVDARGNYLKTIDNRSPQAGDDVWLTIDIDMQAYAEQLLQQQLAVVNRPEGALVVIDPVTGGVLAMASRPSYDPRKLVNGIDSQLWAQLNDKAAGQPLFNWALQGTYAPGSTFKLFTASAALEKGFMDTGTKYQDTGVYKLPACTGMKCEFQNAGRKALGQVDLPLAITKSSDTYFYWIADRMWADKERFGVTPIQEVARIFGLGAKTGVELAGEASGRIPDGDWLAKMHAASPKAFPRGKWTVGDNLNTAIGQGDVLATPLQMAVAYGAFANNGVRMKTHIIDKVTRPKDLGADPGDPANFDVVRTKQPEEAARMTYTGDHYSSILSGLRGVTASGYGTAATPWRQFRAAWPIASKTGTAQVTGDPKDTSLYAAFGPSVDGVPAQYSMFGVVPGAGFGAEVAAPMVMQLMKALSDGTLPTLITELDQKRRAARAAAAGAAAPPANSNPPAVSVAPAASPDPGAVTTAPAAGPTVPAVPGVTTTMVLNGP
jgi:penicillin-binding protein 2